METQFGDYLITDDRTDEEELKVCELLSRTYWAAQRPETNIRTSLNHSICISALHNGQQVAFARIVTDQSTFAWIADVIVDPAHRGQSLG